MGSNAFYCNSRRIGTMDRTCWKNWLNLFSDLQNKCQALRPGPICIPLRPDCSALWGFVLFGILLSIKQPQVKLALMEWMIELSSVELQWFNLRWGPVGDHLGDLFSNYSISLSILSILWGFKSLAFKGRCPSTFRYTIEDHHFPQQTKDCIWNFSEI